MMNKKRQMILFDEDIYQSIQDDIVEHKMRCRGDIVADVCNKFRYEQKKKWHLTTLTEAASSELENDVKKDYKKSPYPGELFAIIIESVPITKSWTLLKIWHYNTLFNI
ncbi:hypothetical protein [Priestia megaterium]|uniref:hypothetical protein n=1 Tax=Priestia megaterium TaxID=1404 RepID=UPI00077D76E6|nr:hypothetical protein [Priestia megaterium]